MGSYIPSTRDERQQMLEAIGLSSIDDLYAVVPAESRVTDLDLPEGMTELQVKRAISAIAEKNVQFKSIFRGAGSYNHYIPAIVSTITSKEEFVTAYTPYQAEISQGVLQNIFEYQTQVCELFGMDVSNASVYDGGTAAAEAVFMCQGRKKTGVVVSGACDPQYIEVVETYCASRDVDVAVVPAVDCATDVEALKSAMGEGIACVLFQSPNFYGVIEDAAAIIDAAHEAGAKAIMSCNPISLGLLKTPGELDADIAIAEGQPLGMPIAFGGPYLGIMACKKDMMRQLPGRIVGETTDDNGNRAFVLTLQAREQHIRREKASSNICSNEALCAMTASVYLAAVGPKGLAQVANNCAANAHYLASKLCEIDGFELTSSKPFFNEFVATCPIDAVELESKLAAKGILSGLPVEGGILWCATELNDKAQIDELIDAIKEVLA